MGDDQVQETSFPTRRQRSISRSESFGDLDSLSSFDSLGSSADWVDARFWYKV